MIIPDCFDLNNSSQYVLVIKVAETGYGFGLYNPQTEDVFFEAVKQTGNENAFTGFKNVFFDNDFFSLTYKDIYIINCTEEFTFVPSSIYSESDKRKYFEFNFAEYQEVILSQFLGPVTLLFTFPKEEYEFFVRSFINPRFIHHQSPLIVFFQDQKTVQAHKMIVSLEGKNKVDIVCYDRDSFVLGNHFSCQSKEDIIYFILFIWKQLKFNQLEDLLYIIGVEEDDLLIGILRDYLKNMVVEGKQLLPYGFNYLISCGL